MNLLEFIKQFFSELTETLASIVDFVSDLFDSRPFRTVTFSIIGGGIAYLAAPIIAATAGALGLLGSASTGISISSLSGAALTNASLASIGGGSLATGGGGMALGSCYISTFGSSVAGGVSSAI